MGLPQVGAVKPAVEGKSYHIKPQTSNLKLQTANRDTLQVVQSWLTRQLLMPQSRTRYKRQTANCMRTLQLHTMKHNAGGTSFVGSSRKTRCLCIGQVMMMNHDDLSFPRFIIRWHVAHHTSHLTPHKSHITPRTSHVTRLTTSHLMCHASRIAHHTSHVTHQVACGY
jgi:hypothetical protein